MLIIFILCKHSGHQGTAQQHVIHISVANINDITLILYIITLFFIIIINNYNYTPYNYIVYYNKINYII